MENIEYPQYNSKSSEQIQKEKEIKFSEIANKFLNKKDGSHLEYNLDDPKWEFLIYLSKKYPLLFHGSNVDVEKLEPRQGMCKSKEFGRQNAVYATSEPIIPIFQAILNRKINGTFITDTYAEGSGDERFGRNYTFEISQSIANAGKETYGDGVIYILPRDGFQQGTDDDGNLIDEWINKEKVQPLAKLKVSPEDFPLLSEIKVMPNSTE